MYLINANPHNFPSTRSIKQGSDAIEEERRCLYVALTRAKDYLNIYRFMKSLHTQSTDEKAQNLYFFNQLPTELVNIIVRGVEQKDFPKYDHSNQAEAEFPDFDFD